MLQNLLCFHYSWNQPSWKIHGIASINFKCFTIDELNQVKVSHEIMRCQGYFLKIALGTRAKILLDTSLTGLRKKRFLLRMQFKIILDINLNFYTALKILYHGTQDFLIQEAFICNTNYFLSLVFLSCAKLNILSRHESLFCAWIQFFCRCYHNVVFVCNIIFVWNNTLDFSVNLIF